MNDYVKTQMENGIIITPDHLVYILIALVFITAMTVMYVGGRKDGQKATLKMSRRQFQRAKRNR